MPVIIIIVDGIISLPSLGVVFSLFALVFFVSKICLILFGTLRALTSSIAETPW